MRITVIPSVEISPLFSYNPTKNANSFPCRKTDSEVYREPQRATRVKVVLKNNKVGGRLTAKQNN